ncbi:hypothetical protein GpartN1_g1525.t1 [Galdieria partita]|uniref:Uncharacterized protein n=1 Tax=Galdieria partita TaxID=83374 RepID=A0A9C7PRH5_9RHOD|nr:hypothetical protein GpartN1_g478.t1 [Galdieria partita]GJQ09734.1 hypothetical protein GpartN1_g1525.t1 [Galdieria partita]
MASPLLVTCVSDYECISHSLARIKLLLENLNSGTLEKLPGLEQKSRILKEATTKRYEPLAWDYVHSCIDKLCEFYLENLEYIISVFQQGIVQEQYAVDSSLSKVQQKKQNMKQAEEEKRHEINMQGAKTLEILQEQKESLQSNIKLLVSEMERMEMELNNIKASLNDEQHNYDCETLIHHRNNLQEQLDVKQRELQDLKEQSRLREIQLHEYSSALDSQHCGTNWEAEKELVAKTNSRLSEQINKMQNVISKRFPSKEGEIRSLALAELQNEMALSSLQHSILENATNQQFSECKKLLHALGTLIRNGSANTRTATAIIKILDIFFQDNEIAEKQTVTCERLEANLETEEAKEALSEMIRLGLLEEHETGLFALASGPT